MKSWMTGNPAAWIQACVEDFVEGSRENDLGLGRRERVFDRPLVGFASGADGLFEQYVAHIGPFYLTPLRIFQLAFPEHVPVRSEQLTVISWILPATATTRAEQSRESKHPSERWARTRFWGEQFNVSLRRHVVERLDSVGVKAVAPMLAPFWSRSDEGSYAPCSNWSERHAAYAAGLGTFGLCDGLISAAGKAIRTGSVVARLSIPPTPRPYADHHAYCLHYSQGTCGKCVDRCPVNALSRSGHNKRRCMQYTEHSMRDVMLKKYGIETYACGLCQVAVPCMDHIPGPEEG